MTLDEAIRHAEEVAEEQEKAAKEWHESQVRKCELIPFAEMDYTHENECKKCAEEHRQLAEWLRELRRLKEQEPILDKIRAEIDQYLFQNEFGLEYRKEVSQIVDKYKAEGSDKEENADSD